MHAILVGLLSVSHTPEQADHAARSVLDEHAHELAEKQRKDLDYDSGDATPDFIAGRLSGADLIDPKAQRASTEGDNP